MSYDLETVSFPSRDGLHTVYGEIYRPESASPRGVVQISHGMTDYTARYKNLIEFLTGEGFIVCGHHHLGHGKTARDALDFGFFADKGGVELLVRDMHSMNRLLRERFPELPVIMLGHSMGSFISRLYANKYPHTIAGLIIHGTGGPNKLLNMGIFMTRLIGLFCGKRHRSALVSKMAFGSYNSRFPKSEGKHAWLTREVSLVSGRDEDEYTNFTFTLSAYRDLFTLVKRSNHKSWFQEYPKDMPTFVMSGSMDPVGDYGKGPTYVYKQLLISGVKNVKLKLYEGARHELFNEIGREEVFSDILEFLRACL